MHALANIQGIPTPLLWFKRKRDPIISETAPAVLNVTALTLTPVVVDLPALTDSATSSLAPTALTLTPVVVDQSTDAETATTSISIIALTTTIVVVELPSLEVDSAPTGLAITSLTKTPV
jgi:hypothetical protein